jgi:aspartyl-tRNA(Asn)/glutamyl-tRNA(Gln) amidotransferase subunit C
MLTRADVEKLAQLSRLQLSEGEKERFGAEIESILSYVSEIQSIAAQEPTKTAGEVRNVMREDTTPHESGIHTDTLVPLAPASEGNAIKVKTILSK